MSWIKRILIGKPLENEALKEEKYSVFWGLPILASDPISSVAYATEEILLVLVPAIGALAFHPLSWISGAIVMLLVVLTFSYRQTIKAYPSGGGAYIVASDNLGQYAGVIAGSALALDYILTVAVSIAAGTAAITSAFPALFQHQVAICLVILIILFFGNLRGIRESAKLFGLPTYAFIISVLVMIITGILKVKIFHYVPSEPMIHLKGALEPITIFLILRAFASGCTALTGVEAVSNAVPNFKEPTTKHAREVLLLLSFFVFILFAGISFLANVYHVVPIEGKTVLSQIAAEIFGGHNWFFYFFQFVTALILALAANTAFADFPMLFSVMSRDGYAPRQLSIRGERLSFSNGIVVLTLIAALLLVVFRGDTHRLIPLYAVGVFISFTLSQFGMFIKWIHSKEKGRAYKAIINGTGAVVTLVTVVIIGSTKFIHGAWIIIVVIPILMTIMIKIKKHYTAVAEQLRLKPEELKALNLSKTTYRNHVIVPVESVNKASVRALRYAQTISDNVVAFNVAIDEEAEVRFKEKWNFLQTNIPLIVKYSPYRKVVSPLIEFIESYEEHSYQPGDMITVVLPQFSVNAWWQVFLHNQSRLFITRNLLKHKHIVIATIPLQLKQDQEVLDKKHK
ncbi:MAG TPA: amino acid permease [Firmicutes bacterium]|jgi:amino acid transporter|nr:amino acid permease [Bacillota bacterium]